MIQSASSRLAGASLALTPPQIWGGVECTYNRVQDRYFDQIALSGHFDRGDDFERIVGLGIKTLRFGLLWERYCAKGSWTVFDTQMARMQEAGIRPIAGLVHHGSGPQHTSLVDPEFPEKLAKYAGAVAKRYPHVDAYTPVNEPNTTARFSGMYGVWYPHHMSLHSYLKALVHQAKATCLSMKAIREVRSDAHLIQTEDLGRIWATPPLTATGDLMNERRWLAFDLLSGKVDRNHALFSYMLGAGISEQEIHWFQDHPCPPNVVGVNYYLTSDRFLDHRTHLYPENRLSSEGNFVDVEAVRVRPEGIAGFECLLLEGWERYRIPVAVTEVHLGCTVDEQVRWALEAWHGALKAQQAGANCIAITFWALLGSFFWNTLVTSEGGEYEAGVFDVSGGTLAETGLAELVTQLTRGEPIQYPDPSRQGWWRDVARLHFHHPVTEIAPTKTPHAQAAQRKTSAA